MSQDRARELAVQFQERLGLDAIEMRMPEEFSTGSPRFGSQLRRNAIPGVVLGEFVGYNSELYEVD